MSGRMVCVDDFEEFSKKHLSKATWEFYSGGADECQTVSENRNAFKRFRLRPRFLRDVSHRDLSTTLLGERVECPICVSPTGLKDLACPQGDIYTAKVAAEMETCMVVSTFSNSSAEDIMSASPCSLKWFQMYFMPNKVFTQRLVQKVERAGYKALVVTIDLPIVGKRYSDIRNKFQLPPHVTVPNLLALKDGSEQDSAKDGRNYGMGGSPQDPTFSWKDVDWLSSITSLPIILKGILTAEDAGIALDHPGVKGILVSNHGGRQLDGVPATVEALPEIVRAVGNKLEVYLDGGVRTGTDALKALALGARAVFIGRPVIWGLTFKGEEGVRQVMNILRDELDLAMALSGCCTLGDIQPTLVVREDFYHSRL
ncbi:2-Hydroxyacid oxidase 2-like isoform X1 [Branchiostoma lanceolatum]|uniref:2-Hydroxyacid oxidase 2-like isoform X1 n=1 Tax=Branchiostoma lanceolatum TaxID=7740 RepID=UPI00345146E7